MSVQGIYFSGLTVLLVLYYIVVISMDLFKHGKKGGSNEESIDIDDDEQRYVDETDEGFSVSTGGDEPQLGETGDGFGEPGALSDGIEEEDLPEEEEATIVNEEDYIVNGGDYPEGSPEDMDATIADIQQQMEENLSDGDPQYQEVMDSMSFEVMLEQPRSVSSSSKILKTFKSDL